MSNSTDYVLLKSSHGKEIPTGKDHWDFQFVLNRPGKIVIEPGYFFNPLNGFPNIVGCNRDELGDSINPNTKRRFHFKLFEPDGKTEFVKNFISLKELRKYRDLRGIIQGVWTLRIYRPKDADLSKMEIDGNVSVTVTNKNSSKSAAPLLNKGRLFRKKKTERFEIDIYRIGTLSITLSGQVKAPFLGLSIPVRQAGTVTLIDPDGKVVAKNNSGTLQYPITQRELSKSRNFRGEKRNWSLTVDLKKRRSEVTEYRLVAQITNISEIDASVLNNRLKKLLGTPNRPNFKIYINWDSELQKNAVYLTVNNKRLAETLVLHDLLNDHDPCMINERRVTDPQLNRPYLISAFEIEKNISETLNTLLGDGKAAKVIKAIVKAEEFIVEGLQSAFSFLPLIDEPDPDSSLDAKIIDLDIQVQARKLTTKSLEISIGKSIERFETITEVDLPAIEWPSIDGISGAKEQFTDFFNSLSDIVKTREQSIFPKDVPSLFCKLKIDGDFLVDIEGTGVIIKIPELGFEIALVAEGGKIVPKVWIDCRSIRMTVKGLTFQIGPVFFMFQQMLLKMLNSFVSNLLESNGELDSIMDTYMGGRFDFVGTKFKKNKIQFKYIPPNEFERKPKDYYVPKGEKKLIKKFPNYNQSSFFKDRVDHIVVMMMENRSFDHVLGYRSLNLDGLDEEQRIKRREVNGLTQTLITDYLARDNRMKIRPMSKASGQIVTKFPFHVGHEYDDVLQQLGSDVGFIENFLKHYPDQNIVRNRGYEPCDVMAYYTDKELPMYGYLADQFAIADGFHCSHPGPTLPNRMFSLTGQLLKTAFGEPEMHNSVSSLQLSRQPTIFDVLSEQGVNWRQYESPPSVSMLRYFARYAGAGEDKIRNINSFESDIRRSDLKAVTFVDAAFHYAPVNDDHPPADMLNGQLFVKRIYDALRSNEKIFNRTLFIVTYDEHGGFFDHVKPGIAEILKRGKGKNSEEIAVNYGIRVPTFFISPYIEKGRVFHDTWDFTSILKTILNRFCHEGKPFLTDRIAYTDDLSGVITLEKPRPVHLKSPKIRKPKKDPKEETQEKFFRKTDLTKRDADWHNQMEVLSRMIRG